jgi:Ca2+/Na+ antiporter
MDYPVLAPANITPPASDGFWLPLVVIIAIAVVAFFTLCVSRTVAANGRVDTRIHLPAAFTVFALNIHANTLRHRRKATVPNVCHLSPARRRFYATTYRVQEVVFGLVLYLFGLALMVVAALYLTHEAQRISRIWPLILTIAGLLSAIVGVKTVILRDRKNPYLQGGTLSAENPRGIQRR